MTLMTRLFFDYFDIFFLTLILLFVKVWVRFEITNVFCDIITRHNEVNFEHSLLMVRVDIINTTMDLGVVTKGIRDLSFWLRKLSSISIKRFSN